MPKSIITVRAVAKRIKPTAIIPTKRDVHILHVLGGSAGATARFGWAKRDISDSRVGRQIFFRKYARLAERCSRLSTQDWGTSVLSTCSTLNFSAHAMTGLQTN